GVFWARYDLRRPPHLAGADADGGGPAGGREPPPRNPRPPSPAAVRPPARLPRLQALALPRLRPPLRPPLPRPPPPQPPSPDRLLRGGHPRALPRLPQQPLLHPHPGSPQPRPGHSRFSLDFRNGDGRTILGCRDGLVLLVDAGSAEIEVLVWDPVTGDQHRFVVPPVIDERQVVEILNGAVLRTAGILDDRPFRFQVVLAGIDRPNKRLFACVYSSETSKWGDPIWVSVDSPSNVRTTVSMRVSSTLVGNSLYWSLNGDTAAILQFDLGTQRLAAIPLPLDKCSDGSRSFRAMPVDGGGLGILELLDFNIQLWKREIDRDGVVSWVLGKTIELDQLLSLDKRGMSPMMLGYCEVNNVVFLRTVFSIFIVQLESLKFSKPPIQASYFLVHPFTSVYTAGNNQVLFYN
uniref:F-box protein AT5G49610-like beta-propeller domain-containing protein n=1 Tax=Aegilops tauschii subsp. strangulata TaxID=200361 RepID=A0A453LYV5_AEGTS